MIETPEGNLTKGMRQLNGVFTQWSNRRHQHSGHLFQGRYKAIFGRSRRLFFRACSLFCAQSGAGLDGKASTVLALEQLWRDDGKVWGAAMADDRCIVGGIWQEPDIGQAKYQEFVEDGLGKESIWKGLKGQIYLGDDGFVEQMRGKRGEEGKT